MTKSTSRTRAPEAAQPLKLRWGKYIKPYTLFFILGPILMITEVIGEVVTPKLLAYIINYGVGLHSDDPVIFEKNVSAAPAWVSWLYGIVGNNSSAFVVTIAAGMILTALLMMVGGVGGAYFGTKASVNFAADLRSGVYRKVQMFSFSNIDKFSTGSLVTRLTNDVTQVQNFVATLLRMALRAPGMLIGALIMAIIVSPQLSWIIGASVGLMVVVIVIFLIIGGPRFMAMQAKVDGLNANVQESITNVRVVKSFVREEYESKHFAETNADLKRAGMRAMMMVILIMPLMTFFMNAATLSVLWFGGNLVLEGGMLIGDLTSFVTYITQILSSLMMTTMIFLQFSRASASAKRIREVIEEPIDITDAEASGAHKVTAGDVEFRHVTFRYYKNSEGKVLDDVNLRIKGGSTVGIIGSTGSGKSTLVSMIPRLYDVDEGEVLVDGVNVKDYALYDLREGVGMVLQKNVLFSGTIMDNLLWGDENADEETVRHYAAEAQADGFVTSFKDGYQSDLGQGGANVSGGQKQRLCIARALLKKPRILILDDSTSAVDTATEARIRETFHSELRDATKIIIAQRITSVMDSDQIIVVNEGRITGMGTHEELLSGNKEYREIYESQMDAIAAKAAVLGEEVMA